MTYWEMKQRAGIVGAAGIGPLLGRLHETQSTLRVHVIGHSFGARGVSSRCKASRAEPKPRPSSRSSYYREPFRTSSLPARSPMTRCGVEP